jgi:hypothetical protein
MEHDVNKPPPKPKDAPQIKKMAIAKTPLFSLAN